MKKIALLLLLTILASLLPAQQAQARRKTRRGARAAAQAPQPTITHRTLECDGVTLLYDSIDAPAYYKVSKDAAGFSNGYSDNSFAIDWPTSLNGSDAEALRRALLTWLTAGNADPLPTIDRLVKERTECDFNAGGAPRRVAKLPGGDESEPLCDVSRVRVHRLTSKLLVYAWEYHGYYGGGTAASTAYETAFLNYDLAAGRALTLDDVLRPEAVSVLEAELKNNADEWDFLWDEFKAAPRLSDQFCIEADKILFCYDKYRVAPGLAGQVIIELPMSALAPYLKIDIQ